MRRLITFFLSSFFIGIIHGQIISTVQLSQENLVKNKDHFSFIINMQVEDKSMDFSSLSLKSKEDLSQQIMYLVKSTKEDTGAREVHEFEHSNSESYWISEQLYFDGKVQEIQFLFSKPLTAPLQLRLFQIPSDKELPTVEYSFIADARSCPCPFPGFLDREAWCPDDNCPPNPDPETTAVSHLIVHHSAGTNVSTNWAFVVESIWDFHVNVNGWSDIGYNWLVDPEGIIYEGRGNGIQGAHFCGANSKTAGFCLLGDFTQWQPTPQAMARLTELLAWNSCDRNLDPLGSGFHSPTGDVLPRIAGHRDGCATQCPGNAFYPTLQNLRQNVQDQIDFACEDLSSPTNLSGETVSSTSISLEWFDNSLDEDAFLLERAEWTNQSYLQIAAVGKDTTEYLDEDLQPNTVYFYRVRAINESDTTAYSNELGISTVLQASQEISSRGIKIFPNPANNEINLDLVGSNFDPESLEVHDLFGRKLFTRKHLDQSIVLVPLPNYPTGTYILVLRGEKEILRSTFQIQ